MSVATTAQKFLFHKHLTLMQCRKDLILENDFTNQKIKNKNISIFDKYSKKIKDNKLRIAYLAGFCLCFSLSPLYDLVFQSELYHTTSSFLFDRNYLPALKELQSTYVNYGSPLSKELGEYFLQWQLKYRGQQLNGKILSVRMPELIELGEQAVDVNTFVSMCLKKGIKVQDLPTL